MSAASGFSEPDPAGDAPEHIARRARLSEIAATGSWCAGGQGLGRGYVTVRNQSDLQPANPDQPIW